MRFEVKGPFALYRTHAGFVDASALARRYYWDWIEDNVPGLPSACGCYIFSVRASRGSLPWYVGKAERQSFRKECLAPHKILHFNNALAGRRGEPELFFLPQVTRTGKYRAPTSSQRPAIRELESLLIGMAINRNPGLLNVAGTKWLQEISVDGFLNSKKARHGGAKKLRELFGK